MWLKKDLLLFLYLSIMGIVFSIFIPPFQKPDENRHYYQASALSRGILTCQKNADGTTYLPLPKSVVDFPGLLKFDEIAHTPSYKFTPGMFNLYRYPAEDPPVHESEWCSYEVIGHLPNSLGLLIGRLTGSRLLEFYAGRLAGLLIFLVAFGYSLRIGGKPARPWLLLFALTPMTLHQVTEIGYDSFQLTLLPLIFAYVISSPLKGAVFPFLINLLLFVIAKPAYFPFLFLSLLTGKPKIYLPFLVSSAVLLFVFLRFANYLGSATSVDVNPQSTLFLADPLYFLKALIATVTTDTQALYEGLVGNFGWLDYKLHYLFYLLWPAAFMITALSKPLKILQTKNLLLIIGIITSVILLVFASLYLIWTPVGADYVTGVQGRYFLVLIPFVGLIFQNLISLFKENVIARKVILTALSSVFLLHLTSIIYYRYYDYSHYGINDQEIPQTLGSELVISTSQDFHIPLPAQEQKIAGFYYLPITTPYHNIAYRYQLLDSTCSKVLRSGYLQSIRESVPGKLSSETFAPFWLKESSFCLRLSPLQRSLGSLTLTEFNGSYFKPLYLITSLRNN